MNAQLRSELDTSGNAASALRLELDEKTEHGECLRCCNVHLLNERNEAQSSVVVLELKLATTEADAAASSAASEKHLEEYRSKIAKDLASLRQAYERNINGLGRICVPISGGAPSVEGYLRWLKSEVDFLPQVFAGMNENSVSVAVEGVLQMITGETSVDLEALQRVATDCGMLVLPGPRDVKKTV
jgi:hypothetical protein